MSRQEHFTREQVLQQLFSQQPSSEPEEDAKEPDREADGQGDGEADREEDREDGDGDNGDSEEDEDDDGDYEDDDGDYEDYDPVGDASADSSSLEEEEEGGGQDHSDTTTTTTRLVERETFPSRNGEITWSSRAYVREEGHCSSSSSSSSAAAPRGVPRGPTIHATSRTGDLASTFHLFITPTVENIILEMTNREGRRKYGDELKGMDETDLRAYVGLLILAGVYRSRGEAAASLWDAESGRAIFRATMPLKLFHTFSRLLHFDDRETRRTRRATDKLAAVREVWDAWVSRLPHLYNPGPEVTVDEQLVPFRGRCPFRQYMPSKPAKYGMKSWVACDAKSSYAWKMQVYTGKPSGGRPERNQGLRVVLDVTEGLHGRNVTCDNYFTSYELARQLLERKLTVVGTVRKNKPELPTGLSYRKGL